MFYFILDYLYTSTLYSQVSTFDFNVFKVFFLREILPGFLPIDFAAA